MTKLYLTMRKSALVVAALLVSGVASAATLDISVSDVSYTDAKVVITPSDDSSTFFYGLESSADFEAKGGSEGIVKTCIGNWENMGTWYSKTWQEMLPTVLYTGQQQFQGKELNIGWDTEYVVYAFGMDSATGEVTVPVVTEKFRTLPRETSENTFSIKVDKVVPTEGSSFYMDVTVTVTPSNNDPYAVQVQQSSVLDFYDGSDETKTEEAYFKAQFAKFVQETYTGTQTLTFNRQKKGKDMYVVVAGFNGAPTTVVYKLAFRTDETPAEPEGPFVITVSGIEKRDAMLSYKAADANVHYFRSVLLKTKFDEENAKDGGIYRFDCSWFEFMGELSDTKTWNEIFYEATVTGETSEYATVIMGDDKLAWGTEYVAYAYGINEDGELITDITTVTFSTLPRQNNTELTFEFSLLGVEKTEGKSTYTARIGIVPSTDAPYGVHYHDVYYYDWYIDNPDYTWEDYLEKQFDKYIRQLHTGETVVECTGIRADKEYYCVAAGHDGEAPTTLPFVVKFSSSTQTGIDNLDVEVCEVYGAEGRVVAPEGSRVFNLAGIETGTENLPAGIYVVRTDTDVYKVRVK